MEYRLTNGLVRELNYGSVGVAPMPDEDEQYEIEDNAPVSVTDTVIHIGSGMEFSITTSTPEDVLILSAFIKSSLVRKGHQVESLEEVKEISLTDSMSASLFAC